MNYQDRIVGGGLPSLMGHGDVDSPGAFQFAQKSEPVVRYAVGGDVSGYQNQDDPYGLDRNLFMPQGQQPVQQPAQQPVAPQTPAAPFGQMLDLGQRTPVVRPDVQAPVAQQPAAQQAAPTIYGYDRYGNPVTSPNAGYGHMETQGSGDQQYDVWVQDKETVKGTPEYYQEVKKNPDFYEGELGGSSSAYQAAMFDLSKYGWNKPTSINYNVDQGGESGAGGGSFGKTIADPEFADWLEKQGLRAITPPTTGDQQTTYLLDKDNNVLDSKTYTVDRGKVGFLDKLANVMPALIVGAATGGAGLPAWLAGAAAGAAAPAMKGFVEGQNIGDFLKSTGKAAAMGAIGGQASSYINPAATSIGQTLGGGNEALTKLITDTAAGAGRSLVGSALTGGKNIGENLLIGAAGGAANSALNSALSGITGAAGISPAVMKVIAPTAMAALTGKDWQSALATSGLASLLGSVSSGNKTSPVSSAKENDYGGQTIIFEDGSKVELDKKGGIMEAYDPEGNDVTGIGKGRVTAPAPPPEQPATPPIKTPQIGDEQPPVEQVQVTGQGSTPGVDWTSQWFPPAAPPEGPVPSPAPPPFGATPAQQVQVTGNRIEQQNNQLLNSLMGLIPATATAPIGATPATSGPATQQVQITGQKQTPPSIIDTLSGLMPTGSSLPPELPGVIEGGERVIVQAPPPPPKKPGSLIDDIPWEQLIQTPPISIPPITAPPVTATPPSKGGTGKTPAPAPAGPTKPGTPTSTTGGLDLTSLLALLALMGGEQQQAAPAQPLFHSDLDVENIFGKRWFT